MLNLLFWLMIFLIVGYTCFTIAVIARFFFHQYSL